MLVLSDSYCSAGCLSAGNRCNFACEGSESCQINDDDFADLVTAIDGAYGVTVTKEQLVANLTAQCQGVVSGNTRELSAFPKFSFVCCGDVEQTPKYVVSASQPVAVEADTDSVGVFTRLVRGVDGTPYTHTEKEKPVRPTAAQGESH